MKMNVNKVCNFIIFLVFWFGIPTPPPNHNSFLLFFFCHSGAILNCVYFFQKFFALFFFFFAFFCWAGLQFFFFVLGCTIGRWIVWQTKPGWESLFRRQVRNCIWSVSLTIHPPTELDQQDSPRECSSFFFPSRDFPHDPSLWNASSYEPRTWKVVSDEYEQRFVQIQAFNTYTQ